MTTHHQADLSIFLEQWNIYQTIIEHNYMFHAEIIDRVKKRLKTYRQPHVLDLGCGDAYIISQCIEQEQSIHYTGVDSSDMPLQYAVQNFQHSQAEVELINKDILSALDEVTQSFDVVLSGYSIHHLTSQEKKRCFKSIAGLLNPDGVFIFYDVEMNQQESRDEYLQRACQVFNQTWPVFNGEQQKSISAHVLDNDIPEHELFYRENFAAAGLNVIEKSPLGQDRLFSYYVLQNSAEVA